VQFDMSTEFVSWNFIAASSLATPSSLIVLPAKRVIPRAQEPAQVVLQDGVEERVAWGSYLIVLDRGLALSIFLARPGRTPFGALLLAGLLALLLRGRLA